MSEPARALVCDRQIHHLRVGSPRKQRVWLRTSGGLGLERLVDR
jgi:hypothetical protein